MDEATTARFVHAARALGVEARARRLIAPGFRSPPRILGVSRTLRRWQAGGAQVAVLVRGRPWVAVLADMVEGVVVVNGLKGSEADQLRTALWRATEGSLSEDLSTTKQKSVA
jgi:hypothetical protein